MRRFVRVVLLALGSILSLVGLVAAVLIGPNNIVGTGDRALSSESAALATSTSVLSIMGPTLHVAATVPDGEVFVGIGHPVDVGDYLEGVAHDEITEIRIPWSVTMHEVDGDEPAPAVPPSTRDWWLVSVEGSDRQEVSIELTEEPMRIVVMSPDGEAPVVVEVEFALEVDSLFTTALLILGGGLAVLAVGIFALRRRGPRRRAKVAAFESEAVHS